MTEVQSAALFGDAVHALLRPGTGPGTVTAALDGEGLAVAGCREIDPSLEDVFIHLVGSTDG